MRRALCAVLSLLFALYGVVLIAQDSTMLVRNDPDQQYMVVKAALQQMYDHFPLSRKGPGDGEYNLALCVDITNYVGPLNNSDRAAGQLADLLQLADQVLRWENDFRKLGVPQEVWDPVIKHYETENLHPPANEHEAIERDKQIKREMAIVLNDYRKQSGKPLPKFVVGMAGCGSGEIEMHLAMVPPDGQLFVIPVFLYKLCQAQHLDPADRKSCDHWIEVVNGTTSYVVGSYVYMARWSDGVVRCGPLSFNVHEDRDKTVSITKLQSPECNPGW